MAYLIYCEDDPGVALTPELMAVHRAYIDGHQHVIRAGGPLMDEALEQVAGRVLFTTFETRAEAEAFLAAEPYAQAGRVRRHIIQPMIIRSPS